LIVDGAGWLAAILPDIAPAASAMVVPTAIFGGAAGVIRRQFRHPRLVQGIFRRGGHPPLTFAVGSFDACQICQFVIAASFPAPDPINNKNHSHYSRDNFGCDRKRSQHSVLSGVCRAVLHQLGSRHA
jgi:hypothetical protein